MAEIVPAILEETKEGFLHKTEQVTKLPGVLRIQVDFGDGVFVPHKTLPVQEMDVMNPAFLWEAHLMVQHPMDFLDYHICGFKTIIVHYEAYKSADDLRAALIAIKSLNLKCGIAINPETEVEALAGFGALADQFTVLSVHPGFQGGEFVANTPERIKALRSLLPNATIEADGGVAPDNIHLLVASGADLLVVGSHLVKAANIPEAYEGLQKAMVL